MRDEISRDGRHLVFHSNIQIELENDCLIVGLSYRIFSDKIRQTNLLRTAVGEELCTFAEDSLGQEFTENL